jgi:hypothetical protein
MGFYRIDREAVRLAPSEIANALAMGVSELWEGSIEFTNRKRGTAINPTTHRSSRTGAGAGSKDLRALEMLRFTTPASG